MRLIYHPDAERELIEAAEFYERRVPTLGAQFLEAVDRAIGVIQEAPDRWRIIESDIRSYPVSRFPYKIHYRILEGGIRILVFKHSSRDPNYWRYRLAD